MKKIILATAVALVGLLALLTFVQGSTVQQRCSKSYIVKPGDNLSRIAQRTGKSVWELAELNSIRNVHRIYAGQWLCIESRPSNFNLAATYKFAKDTDKEASNWTLGRNRMAGRRLRYPLLSGDSIHTVTNTHDVVSESRATADPLLWLVRNGTSEVDYTLVTIGDSQPISDLLEMVITPTSKIADIIPTTDLELVDEEICPTEPVKLVNPKENSPQLYELLNSNTISISAELEARDGTFIPINISAIDHQENIEYADWCYDSVGFALYATASPQRDGYELIMVFTDKNNEIGPPGSRWRSRCSNWSSGGRWNRWRSSWFGC